MWRFRNGDNREKRGVFQTKLRSHHQYELILSKYFLFPRHNIYLNNSFSFYHSPNDSNLFKAPQWIPQISSLNSNKLPHKPFTFIISLKYQIKTPGCVHQLLCNCLLVFSLAPSEQAPPLQNIYFSVSSPRHCMHLNKPKEQRRQPAKLRNVLCGGFLTTENGGQPGIPFARCLVGISCSPMSSEGRTLLLFLRSPSLASLLCILSVKDVCKWDCSGPYLTFPWACVCKALCQPPQKEMPQNFF